MLKVNGGWVLGVLDVCDAGIMSHKLKAVVVVHANKYDKR